MGFDTLTANASATVFRLLGTPATYSPPGGVAVDVTVIRNRFLQESGFESFATEVRTSIALLKSEVPAPVRNGVVAIGAEQFTLQAKIDDDGVQTVWAVT